MEKYLAKSELKDMFEEKINQMSAKDKIRYEKAMQAFENSHAKDPLKWAMGYGDEIKSSARFSLLRDLTLTVEDVEGCIADAQHAGLEYCTETEDIANEMMQNMGKEKFENFMKAYMMGAMWQLTNLLDEGNFNGSDNVGWALCETNEDGEVLPERFIGGLHEDIIGFVDEIEPAYLKRLFG